MVQILLQTLGPLPAAPSVPRHTATNLEVTLGCKKIVSEASSFLQI